ncbi:hypothetical protein QTO30_14690 [Yoonia sp. GPGPB17]|uniref:hypothetical protein n=1 Tax=Yoonia sp. GPGPB17 TaxID=3026147 RepID=UPI0030C4B9C7
MSKRHLSTSSLADGLESALIYSLLSSALLTLSVPLVSAETENIECQQLFAQPAVLEFIDGSTNNNSLDVVRGWNAWDRPMESRIRIDDVIQHTAFEASTYDSAFWLNLDLNHDGAEDLVIATDLLQGNGRPSYRKSANIRAYCSEGGQNFVSLQSPCSMLSLGGSVVITNWDITGAPEVERYANDGWTVGVAPLNIDGNNYLFTAHSSVIDEEVNIKFLLWSLNERAFSQIATCQMEN